MKNSKCGFVSLPVLIFAFLGLVITSGFMYVNYNQPKEIVQEENLDLSRGEALRDWKTYKNEKYGFEFQYQGEVKFNEISEEVYNLNIVPQPASYEMSSNVNVRIYKDDGFVSLENDSDKLFNLLIESEKKMNPKTSHIVRSYFGGEYNSVYAEYEYYNDGYGISIPRKSYFVYRNGLIYEISSSSRSNQRLDEITATFKFTK